MDYLDDFGKFNLKYKLGAESYVDNNLRRLMQIFNMDENEDNRNELIEYFTRFPDQISKLNIEIVGRNQNSHVLRTNNIGGVVKYK